MSESTTPDTPRPGLARIIDFIERELGYPLNFDVALKQQPWSEVLAMLQVAHEARRLREEDAMLAAVDVSPGRVLLNGAEIANDEQTARSLSAIRRGEEGTPWEEVEARAAARRQRWEDRRPAV